MTQPAENPALPQATILSYFTEVSSPTRVRRVARTGLRVSAIWHGLWAVAALCFGAYIVFVGLLHAIPLHIIAGNCKIPGAIVAISIAAGLAQRLLSAAVERGSSRACMLLQPTLIVTVLSLFAAAYLTVLIGKEAVEDHRWSTATDAIVTTPTFTIAFAFVICILLIKDLSEFLEWIANNPAAEKPPVPFLPGSASASRPAREVGR